MHARCCDSRLKRGESRIPSFFPPFLNFLRLLRWIGLRGPSWTIQARRQKRNTKPARPHVHSSKNIYVTGIKARLKFYCTCIYMLR